MLHLRGIMALMRTEESFQCQPASGIALLVLGTAAYDQAAGDAVDSFPSAADNNVNTMTVNRLRAVPAAESSLDELVSILPRLSNLFKRAGELVQPSSFHFEAHITSIKEEALALRAELLAWEVKQQRASRVTTIEWFTQAYTLRFPGAKDLVCPTFRADSYDDRKYPFMSRLGFFRADWPLRYYCQYVEYISTMPVTLMQSHMSLKRAPGD